MESNDTFVFAPFMYEQICQIKDATLRLAIFCAVAEYGCYGVIPDFTDNDPSGAVAAMVQGICQAIDRCKARRKTNQENGKRGGAPAGSRNNPNGRRGKNRELTETNRELTETNRELTYNVLMDNGSMDNGSMVDNLTFSNEKVEHDLPGGKSPTIRQQLQRILGKFYNARAKEVREIWNETTHGELAGIVPPYNNTPQSRKRREAIDVVLFEISKRSPGADGAKILEQYRQFAEWLLSQVGNGEMQKPISRAPFDAFMTADNVELWARLQGYNVNK